MSEILAGRYELGRTLGAGGMARVVMAHDRVLRRSVAVKLVAREVAHSADPALAARFVAEARTSARLTHRNLVAVYDAGDSDGYLFLVTELVEGTTLAELLSRQGSLGAGQATGIAEQLLSALEAVHDAGIVHRDVKPSNVLIDQAGTVKLADFGIAKRLDDIEAALTRTGEFVGTPRYVAPEQAAGEASTPATDLYALGVVLYEMLAGEPPFDAESPLATLLAHRDRPAPDVREARPDVATGLAAVITKAMAKAPGERYPSAAAMRTALLGDAFQTTAAAAPTVAAAAMLAAPTSAYPPIDPSPTGAAPPPRHDRRNQAWWWVAVLALLAVGVGALAVASGRGDDPTADLTAGGTAGARSSPAARVTAAPTAAPTSAPPTTVVPTQPPVTTGAPSTAPPDDIEPVELPLELAALVEVVANDPSAFGEHGEELLDELRRVESEHGRKQRDAAADAISQLDEWVQSGELDSLAAGRVAEALRPYLAAGEDDQQGEDKDKDKDDDKGKGKDKDDDKGKGKDKDNGKDDDD